MKKKTIKQSSIVIGLLGLLAIPFMSSGQQSSRVVVKCEIERLEYFSNICLPNPTGGVTPGSLSLGGGLSLSMSSEAEAQSTIIFGTGEDFGEAWEDAQDTCEMTLTTVNHRGKGQRYSPTNRRFDCPFASCESVAPPKGSYSRELTSTCVCIRSSLSKKHTGNQCVELGRYTITTRSYSGAYDEALSRCAQTAQEAQDVGHVYCFAK